MVFIFFNTGEEEMIRNWAKAISPSLESNGVQTKEFFLKLLDH